MARVLPSHVVAFIESSFPAIKTAENLSIVTSIAGDLPTIVRLIDAIPPELITLEGDDYANLIRAMESINGAVAHSRQSGVPCQLLGFGTKSPVAVIRELLSKCHDEGVEPMTADLAFIRDTDLRESIRLDLSSSNRDLVNGEHKGSTVLAGAAVEALLLWAVQETQRQQPGAVKQTVQQFGKKLPTNPENWNLADLIEVALRLALIADRPTADSARLSKDFRNLIHPGRAQRTGTECNRAAALGALSAAEHVIIDLSRKFAL